MATTLLSVAAKSVTDERSTLRMIIEGVPHLHTNVSAPERWLSLVAGSALIVYGTRGKEPILLPILSGSFLLFRALTGHCPISQALKVSTSDSTAPNSVIAAGHGTRVSHTVRIAKPIADVYRFWRDFENLPRFMTHLLDVDTTSDGRSHWIARGPLGVRVEWDAEIIKDIPNQVISWKSTPSADVDTTGSVHFRELGQSSTEILVVLKYDPPGGKLTTWLTRVFGKDPHRQIGEDLERFKQLVEGLPTVRTRRS